MRKYCVIGGIIGLFAGLSLIGFIPLPFVLYSMYLVFLGFIWDALMMFLNNIANPDFAEGIGWLAFLFTALIGVLYGRIIYDIKVAASNRKITTKVALEAIIIIAIITGGYFWWQN